MRAHSLKHTSLSVKALLSIILPECPQAKVFSTKIEKQFCLELHAAHLDGKMNLERDVTVYETGLGPGGSSVQM